MNFSEVKNIVSLTVDESKKRLIDLDLGVVLLSVQIAGNGILTE